mmetsp:Transcript_22598/g.19618  ORF Transcript_22598/g.19618 Transcript_22598/m.19618 type:complete len:364 (+) Transcript_22598:856-1947(+)
MEQLFDQVKKEKEIDIFAEVKKMEDNLKKDDEESKQFQTYEDPVESFHKRALANMMKRTLSRATWFYDEIKLLADGKSPKELSEYDAAKRIGIGTIVGKYHQKALALKGINLDDFKVLKDNFIQVWKSIKLNPHSDQEGSIFTLNNQKDVFLEKDFAAGMDMCKSQFDLVEAFPLVGLAIKIKRYNGSMINPWLTSVKFIAKHHKVVDTISIIKNQNNLRLKSGEDTIENINAVLPLFTKEDADMQPLLQSKLYHLMMTFNVMQNVDTLYDDAYLALLATTLNFMLNQPDSEWKSDILNKIVSTVHIVYGENESYQNYQKALIENPVMAIINDPEQKKYGSIDVSKAILHLYMLWHDEKINQN